MAINQVPFFLIFSFAINFPTAFIHAAGTRFAKHYGVGLHETSSNDSVTFPGVQ